MILDTQRRDRNRLWAYGEIMSELGLHVDELDTAAPDEITAAVRGAVERLRMTGRPSDVMANAPDMMPLGGEVVAIGYLPAAKAHVWRRWFLEGARELDHRFNALAKDLDEQADAEALALIKFDQADAQQEFYGRALAMYLGRDALPESATEAEIMSAHAVAQMRAFFPGLGAMTPALRTQMQASGASSPG